MIEIITYYDRYTLIRLCSMIESDTDYHAPMFAFGRVLEISAVDLGVINKRGFTPVATKAERKESIHEQYVVRDRNPHHCRCCTRMKQVRQQNLECERNEQT